MKRGLERIGEKDRGKENIEILIDRENIRKRRV